MDTKWAIVPVLDLLDYTRDALTDLLAQTGVTCRILVINQGSSDATREALEALAERSDNRILVWSHSPALPSLSATWNRALEFVWSVGGLEALVINNDTRIAPWTYQTLSAARHDLDAAFVTAVGVREREYEHYLDYPTPISAADSRGGPDFSCFLISRACHARFKFDEDILIYTEDVDLHRRMMLAGMGADIFSLNLPYLHYASRTVNQFTPAQQASFAKRMQQSHAYYARKWGGDVNQEWFRVPFSGEREIGVTTPELQRAVPQGIGG